MLKYLHSHFLSYSHTLAMISLMTENEITILKVQRVESSDI